MLYGLEDWILEAFFTDFFIQWVRGETRGWNIDHYHTALPLSKEQSRVGGKEKEDTKQGVPKRKVVKRNVAGRPRE